MFVVVELLRFAEDSAYCDNIHGLFLFLPGVVEYD